MRRIYQENNRNESATVRAYAAAEERGEVDRESNRHGIDSVTYAKALLADGPRKGWLR
jgi:hypothetical protein